MEANPKKIEEWFRIFFEKEVTKVRLRDDWTATIFFLHANQISCYHVPYSKSEGLRTSLSMIWRPRLSEFVERPYISEVWELVNIVKYKQREQALWRCSRTKE